MAPKNPKSATLEESVKNYPPPINHRAVFGGLPTNNES
ncbi:hypothetical protein QN277_006100 [Acacia crassicarpa]|uniref:Uncharacterized protein n=1 Tax=Acacia crassicarpa TaxID=499986 RepID=A0AAE1IXL8_9FABA|nr:hypothetical protein QN277_006100 [Acacia crassicarpa]